MKLWDSSSGQCIHTFWKHSERVHSLTFSPNSRTLTSSSDDQTVRLWDLDTGKCDRTFTGNENWLLVALASQPYPFGDYSQETKVNWRFLAANNDGKDVKLWDINTGHCFITLKGHTDSVWAIAFSHDGQILATSSDDQTVKLWQVNTGVCVKTLKGMSSQVCSLAFSPNNRILAIGSVEQMVQLWDVSKGQRLRTLRGHKHQLWSFSLSPDGQTLATGSDAQKSQIMGCKYRSSFPKF